MEELPMTRNNKDWALSMDKNGVFELYDIQEDSYINLRLKDIILLKQAIESIELYGESYSRLKKIGL